MRELVPRRSRRATTCCPWARKSGPVPPEWEHTCRVVLGTDRAESFALRGDEVIARLQELDGAEEQRISLLNAESDLHPRLIRIAVNYAAEHPDEVRERIDRNRAMTARSRRTSQQREALLA